MKITSGSNWNSWMMQTFRKENKPNWNRAGGSFERRPHQRNPHGAAQCPGRRTNRGVGTTQGQRNGLPPPRSRLSFRSGSRRTAPLRARRAEGSRRLGRRTERTARRRSRTAAKIGDRLNTIYSLCQKHRAADLGELLAKQTDYEARLQAITHGDEAIAAVATELTATEEKAEELARNIHATREKAAPTFNDAIQTTLARLGMPEARFVVQLTPAPALTPTGDDEIDFLFTANGNFAPQKWNASPQAVKFHA